MLVTVGLALAVFGILMIIVAWILFANTKKELNTPKLGVVVAFLAISLVCTCIVFAKPQDKNWVNIFGAIGFAFVAILFIILTGYILISAIMFGINAVNEFLAMAAGFAIVAVAGFICLFVGNSGASVLNK